MRKRGDANGGMVTAAKAAWISMVAWHLHVPKGKPSSQLYGASDASSIPSSSGSAALAAAGVSTASTLRKLMMFAEASLIRQHSSSRAPGPTPEVPSFMPMTNVGTADAAFLLTQICSAVNLSEGLNTPSPCNVYQNSPPPQQDQRTKYQQGSAEHHVDSGVPVQGKINLDKAPEVLLTDDTIVGGDSSLGNSTVVSSSLTQAEAGELMNNQSSQEEFTGFNNDCCDGSACSSSGQVSLGDLLVIGADSNMEADVESEEDGMNNCVGVDDDYCCQDPDMDAFAVSGAHQLAADYVGDIRRSSAQHKGSTAATKNLPPQSQQHGYGLDSKPFNGSSGSDTRADKDQAKQSTEAPGCSAVENSFKMGNNNCSTPGTTTATPGGPASNDTNNPGSSANRTCATAGYSWADAPQVSQLPKQSQQQPEDQVHGPSVIQLAWCTLVPGIISLTRTLTSVIYTQDSSGKGCGGASASAGDEGMVGDGSAGNCTDVGHSQYDEYSNNMGSSHSGDNSSDRNGGLTATATVRPLVASVLNSLSRLPHLLGNCAWMLDAWVMAGLPELLLVRSGKAVAACETVHAIHPIHQLCVRYRTQIYRWTFSGMRANYINMFWTMLPRHTADNCSYFAMVQQCNTKHE